MQHQALREHGLVDRVNVAELLGQTAARHTAKKVTATHVAMHLEALSAPLVTLLAA